MIIRKIKICLILLSLFCLSCSIKFNSDGYSNIIVKIPDSFTIDSLERIQDLFRETSSLLYTATNHRAFFNEIVFLFDSSYDTQKLDGIVWYNATSEALGSPTFSFSSTLDKIRTRQNAFCGQINEAGIILPSDITSKVLVANWAKYRYGVFEETSQTVNECYLDNDEWKLTGCYDVNHQQNILQVDLQDGLYVCKNPGSIDDLFGKADLKSSLMWSSDIDSVKYFCNNETHSSLVPTKHNLFCDGRSVSNVIESSADFLNVGTTNFKSTTFLYAQIKSPRIIFLLHNRINQKRKKITITVLKFFYEYLIEEGTEVGVVTFNETSDDVKRTRELTVVQPIGQRDNSLLSKVIWFNSLESSSDETNSTIIGIEETLKMFDDEQRANIIILIGNYNAMITAIKFPRVHESAKLFLLPYLDKGLELNSYQHLSNGLVPSKDIYPLVDEFGLEVLNTALLDIFNMASESQRIFLVYKTNHLFGHDMMFGNSFATDGAIDGTMVFKVSFDESEDSYEEVYFNGENSKHDFIVNLVPKESQVKHWNFTIKTNNYPNKCVVLVFIIQNISTIQEIHTSYHKIAQIGPSSNQRFVLNVALTTSQTKLNAKATNLIDGNSYTMHVLDDGQDPDLMENDGFYTGYFALGIETQTGLYFVNTVTYAYENTQTAPRYDYLCSIAIYEKQILPPARVLDLKMISVNLNRSLVALSWSEPRTLGYAGILTSFQVKYGINWEDLNESNFDNAEELCINSTHGIDPNVRGKITIECEMPQVDFHFYLALRTRNVFYNVTSRVSNRVRIINGNLLTTPIVSGTDTSTVSMEIPEMTTVNTNCNCTLDQSNYSEESVFSKRTIILIISSSLTVFFVIIIICNLIVCWACDKRTKTNSPSTVIRRSFSNQTSTRRRSFRNSVSRPSSLITGHTINLNQRPEDNSDWSSTPNHLINNNARRDSPSQFIVVSNDSPRTGTNDSRSTIAARTLRQPHDAITFVSPGSRRATTQNRLVFDGSSPKTIYDTPTRNPENVPIQATNPMYDSAMPNRLPKQESFYLGEV